MKRVLVLSFLILSLVSLFPTTAQNTGIYSTAQRFEHGLMIWRSDSAFIWVLGDNGQVFNYPASSYTSLPENPIFGTPSNRLRPIFGFGKVWGNHRSVRDLLGWPTLPEIGFSMPIQYTNRTYYLTQLDGTIIQISPNNTWIRTTGGPVTTVNILSFSASADALPPGGSVTVSWSVQGTQYALLDVFDLDTNVIITQLWDLPLIGTTNITMPTTVRSGIRVVVYAANKAYGTTITMYGREAQRELTIGLNVAAPSSVTTRAAFQQYERGFLIWRADTGGVMMFSTTAPHVAFFRQSDYEGLPDNPITSVPTGFVLPVNGFGRVWGGFQHVRDSVGYATGAEQSYTLTARIVGNGTISYTLPDGRVATVDGLGAWHF